MTCRTESIRVRFSIAGHMEIAQLPHCVWTFISFVGNFFNNGDYRLTSQFSALEQDVTQTRQENFIILGHFLSRRGTGGDWIEKRVTSRAYEYPAESIFPSNTSRNVRVDLVSDVEQKRRERERFSIRVYQKTRRIQQSKTKIPTKHRLETSVTGMLFIDLS